MLFCKKHKYDLAYNIFFSTGETHLQRLDTRKLALASILAGLSAIFEIMPGPPFDIPFPLYDRVSWDLTGMPMMMSLLFTGPIGALYTCLIGCSFIFLRGNLYGGVFKIIAELATILAFYAMRKGFIPKTTAIVRVNDPKNNPGVIHRTIPKVKKNNAIIMFENPSIILE